VDAFKTIDGSIVITEPDHQEIYQDNDLQERHINYDIYDTHDAIQFTNSYIRSLLRKYKDYDDIESVEHVPILFDEKLHQKLYKNIGVSNIADLDSIASRIDITNLLGAIKSNDYFDREAMCKMILITYHDTRGKMFKHVCPVFIYEYNYKRWVSFISPSDYMDQIVLYQVYQQCKGVYSRNSLQASKIGCRLFSAKLLGHNYKLHLLGNRNYHIAKNAMEEQMKYDREAYEKNTSGPVIPYLTEDKNIDGAVIPYFGKYSHMSKLRPKDEDLIGLTREKMFCDFWYQNSVVRFLKKPTELAKQASKLVKKFKNHDLSKTEAYELADLIGLNRENFLNQIVPTCNIELIPEEHRVKLESILEEYNVLEKRISSWTKNFVTKRIKPEDPGCQIS